MDDIRRPHQPERRDYTTPQRPVPDAGAQPAPVHHEPQHHPVHYQPQHQAQPHHPQPHHAPAPPQPEHHQYHEQPAAPPQPQYQDPAFHRPAPEQPAYQAPTEPVHHPVHKKPKRRGLKMAVIIIAPLLAAGLFAAGYSLKSPKAEDGIPASIRSQVTYDLYYPSPMPSGYSYMKETATFQIGQVFYKFANGTKRVTVKEEPVTGDKPNLNNLVGYSQFDVPVGKAAMGSTFNHPVVVVVTPTTIITMNTTGGVSEQSLKEAAQNLKNIGQNPAKS